MTSYAHPFQRLPSDYELEYQQPHQPATSYHGASEPDYQASPEVVGASRFTYQPVANGHNQQTAWTASSTFKTITFLSHLILTLMPVAFIVLAFLALSVDGEPLSHRGTVVYQAAKLGPTIFPIVFAAVVGRLMRTLALWRAERGTTLGLLEQLNGSQNLLAAVERSFMLSNLWGWGIVVIILWALSPLGGQSSLRVLELAQNGDSFSQSLYYFNTDDYNGTIFEGASSLTYGLPAVQAIYQACLLAPASISSSSVDIWGNVKIPLIQAQPGYEKLKTDWIDVPQQNDTVYSSLTGVMISGLHPSTVAQLNIETSYLNLTCPSPQLFGTGDPKANFTTIMKNFQDWMGNILVHNNKSRNPFDRGVGSSDGSGWSSFTIDTNFNFSTNIVPNRTPLNIIFASRNVDIYQIAAYNCSLGFTHVESLVGCNGTSCRVDRIRHSRKNLEPPISTPWNQNGSFVQFFNFINSFPWMSGIVHSAEVTPADFYVAGNNTPFQPAGIGGANYQNVSGLQVAQRLGALFNTVWQSSIAQSSVASPPPDPSLFKNITSPYSLPFNARSVNATMRTDQTVYHASKIWVGLTGTVSLILFACGVAGMLFRYMTAAPDILGYVSTMTRDNPFFSDDRTLNAETLDGLERARLLRDAVVQISDVRPWQGQTHIALKSVAAGENRQSTRLRRNPRAVSPLNAPR